MKRSSLRRQLIAWNTLTLAVLLGALGITTHFVAYGYALHSVDTELADRIHPPPHRGPPPGDGPGGGPNGGPDGPGRGDFGPDGPRGGPNGGPNGGPGGGPNGGGPFGPGPSGRNGDPRGGPGPGGDDEHRPRIFALDGKPMPPFTQSKPWDLQAFPLAKSETPVFTTATVDGELYRVATALSPLGLDGQENRRVVQAAYPLADLNRATEALDRGLLALIPVGVLGAWGSATFLTRRVLSRVGKFRRAADHMSGDDLSGRLPVEGNDEFADLAGTFNGLLGRLEDAFRRQAAALEQQRRFTADASHELKTPLTVIKGTASIALSDESLDEREKGAFAEIDHAADGMVRLVQDLLYLARADAGALGTDRREILALEVLQSAASAVGHLQGGAVDLSGVPQGASLWGNEPELVRLFTNLLSNARRHTATTGHVVVSARADGRATEVVVQDDGCGIAPEHLGQLGQRFFRADSSRSREEDGTEGGTGLGLAIVCEIVRAHDGTIGFESELGKGTRVTVSLPALMS